MDTQLIRNLYDMVCKASAILGKEAENAALLATIKERMPSTYLADEKAKLHQILLIIRGLLKSGQEGDVSFDISKREPGDWKVTNPFSSNPDEQIGVYAHGASNANGHRHCSQLLGNVSGNTFECIFRKMPMKKRYMKHIATQ